MNIRKATSGWTLNTWRRFRFYITVVLSASVMLVAPTLLQAQTQVGSAENISEPLRSIRGLQTSLAAEQEVEIKFNDQPNSSSTWIEGVPLDFRDQIIASESDILSILDQIYIYYGFTGSETLELVEVSQVMEQTRYLFNEYIDGTPTDILVSVYVDMRSRKLAEFQGWTQLDLGIPRNSRISRDEAIENTIRFVEQQGGAADIDPNGTHVAEKIFLSVGEDFALEPAWRVQLEPSERLRGFVGPGYYVLPDGTVRKTTTAAYSSYVRVCDGQARTSNRFCGHPDNPTVIYPVTGSCNTAYTCSNYQGAIDAAEDVMVMWEDILAPNCCNVGENNSANGNNLDINIGGAPAAGVGEYESGSGYAVMVIDTVAHANNPLLIAHEMGHAGFAKANPVAWGMTRPSGPYYDRAEDKAVIEFYGEINSVIYRNYNGPGSSPKWDNPANWVTNNGQNYSTQVHHDDITGANAYADARVGGHAAYKLTMAIGPDAATEIILRSARELADTGNHLLSFAEVRTAMVKAAELVNPAYVEAVEDAFADVGVGSDGYNTPPDHADPGAPATPTITSVTDEGCVDFVQRYDAWYTISAGATHYFYYGADLGGLTWTNEGLSYANPQPLYLNVPSQWKIVACNASGCSAASDAVTTNYLCMGL